MMSKVQGQALTEDLELVGVTGLLGVGDEGGVREAHTRWTMWYSSCCWNLRKPEIKTKKLSNRKNSQNSINSSQIV